MRWIIITTWVLMIGMVSCGTQEEDEVKQFPTWPPHKFKVYSGLFKLKNGNDSFHYFFIESNGNPEKDPIVMWMNGGPGCSSMRGFSTEIGPYFIPDGSPGKTFDPNFNEYS